MIKWVVFLEKKEDISHEEFIDHWHGKHADMAKELPNLQKYKTSVPVNPDEAMYDGIAELYFDSVEDSEALYRSDVHEETIEDSKEFLKKVPADRVFVEEIVQMDKTEDD